MGERHNYYDEIPELDVNRFLAAENGDDEDDEEEEEGRHDEEEEEEEEEEPLWTVSGALIGRAQASASSLENYPFLP